jgi:TIR domain/Effector-associated domain 2
MADDKIEVFICYAHKDESLMRDIERQLNVLVKQELITLWHDRMIVAGIDWKQEVHKHLNAARIILLLVSADFIFSEYSNIEVKRAMERYNAGEAQVIPVILKPVMWKVSPFGKLSPLPKNGKPITSSAWHNRDEALLEVAEGVQQAVEELRRPVVPIGAQSSSGATQSSSYKEQQPMTQDTKNEEFDVFLCHNNKDKPQVIEIAEQLKERGIVPWLDVWELPPGQRWQPLLEKQIGEIKSAAVFVGPSGFGPWQQEELDAFLRQFVSRHCPVIPVLLKGAPEKPELPPFLAGFTWVDFRKIQPDPMFQFIWGITGKKPNAVRSVGVDAKGGGSGAPISNPAPASTSTSKMSLSGLSRQQKSELVDKLLACPTMRDRHTRDTVVQELSFASAISRHTADRVDVTNIVNTSLNYQNGLQDLIEEVGTFEKDASGNDSLPMRQLRAFVDSL